MAYVWQRTTRCVSNNDNECQFQLSCSEDNLTLSLEILGSHAFPQLIHQCEEHTFQAIRFFTKSSGMLSLSIAVGCIDCVKLYCIFCARSRLPICSNVFCWHLMLPGPNAVVTCLATTSDYAHMRLCFIFLGTHWTRDQWGSHSSSHNRHRVQKASAHLLVLSIVSLSIGTFT